MDRFKTKEFLTVQKEWYAKLAEDGFIDHERHVGGEMVLNQQASNVYRQAPTVVRQNKLIYYQEVSKHLSDEKFEYEVDKLVMTMVSMGLTIKEICDALKRINNPKHPKHRQTIRFIIRKWENEWGIREWLPHQMRSKG